MPPEKDNKYRLKPKVTTLVEFDKTQPSYLLKWKFFFPENLTLKERDCSVVVKSAEVILSHNNLYFLLPLRIKDLSWDAIDLVLEALQLAVFSM